MVVGGTPVMLDHGRAPEPADMARLRVVTDGGGKVGAALNVIDGVDRAARFLIGAARKGWREDFTLRFAPVNGMPGIIVDGPDGPVQTAAFEIDGGAIRALYVVRNPDKLRHLSPPPNIP